MIRQYDNTDVEAVVSIWKAASEIGHPFLTQDFLNSEAENVRNVYPLYAEIYVKEINDEVVGFIALLDSEVGAIFLQPKYHGNGIGREMMDFAAAKKGSLTVEVFEKNIVGRRFYDRYGFRETSTYLHEPSGEMTIKMAFNP